MFHLQLQDWGHFRLIQTSLREIKRLRFYLIFCESRSKNSIHKPARQAGSLFAIQKYMKFKS